MPQITINSIILPPDMIWEDEFSGNMLAKTETVTVTGGSIIQKQARTTGRRITLASGQDHAWINRAALQAIQALILSDPPDVALTLGDGRAFSVQFAPTSERPIEARPVQPGKNPSGDDLYVVTIRMMEN